MKTPSQTSPSPAPSPGMRTTPATATALSLLLVALVCQGCLLVKLRPTGDPELRRSDLPDPGQVDGDPVRTFLRPDAIPAIDDPRLVAAGEADFMRDDEMVIGLVLDGVPRAYSVWHLDRHEIVNDHSGDSAIAVTW